MDPTDNRKNPSHSDRVHARRQQNTPWPKLDRSWIDHLFYVWNESDTRDTMPEGESK